MPQITPGSVKIYTVLLRGKNNGAELDITPQVKNISVYENLYDPTIFCELLIEDSIDLWKTFPINGEETVEISYKTIGVDDITTYKFDVFKMKDKKDQTTDKTSIYILQCVSRESIFAAQVGKISTYYELPIEEIITKILSEYLKTDKQLFVEKTKGLTPVSIPNLYCFQAIDFLKERAVSAEVPNSSFVFYENQYGFHFRTIESLLYTKRNDIGSKEFTYDNSVLMNDKEKTARAFRNIIALNKNNLANLTNNLGGGYNNVTENFDIVTKQVEKFEFNFTEKASQIIASDKIATPYNTQEFFADLKQTTKKAKTFFGTKDSSQKSDLLPQSIGNKHAFMTMFDSLDIDILVYGDSTLTIGEPVKIKTVNNTGTTGRKTEEAKIAGNYLITGLRHLISPGPGAIHYTAMKLQKMGFSL